MNINECLMNTFVTHRIQVGDLVQFHGRTAAMVVQVVQMVSCQHVVRWCCSCRCCCCRWCCCWCCFWCHIQSNMVHGSQILAICPRNRGKPLRRPLNSQIANWQMQMDALSFAYFQSHHLDCWPPAEVGQITKNDRLSDWVGLRSNCIYAKSRDTRTRLHAFPESLEMWKVENCAVASAISGTSLHHRRHNRFNRGF